MNPNPHLIGAGLLLLGLGICPAETKPPAILPIPQKIVGVDGTFHLTAATQIHVDADSRETGLQLAERLRRSTGFPVPVQVDSSTGARPPGSITLSRWRSGSDPGPEGYELAVTPDSVSVRASTQAGMFYGVQSLLQLLPAQIFSARRVDGVEWTSPCVQIEDRPRFPWRGLMLDVSRHFFTKSEVEQLLDVMAVLKLNTFHWHLVDDQGWRIAIRKYPQLTEVGAWRPSSGFGLDPKLSTAYGPDGRYGGYYTQSDIREVVAYAQARHITIVPEIEMPGHSSAALAAFPQLSCTGGPFTAPLVGGVFNGIYCVGNDASFEFVENVLTEVFELFPGKYIHVGGDEVPTDTWKHCEKCQAVMKSQGFKQEGELESYFIRRIEKFVNAHGRTLIGWSEIREGGLARNATVMDWIGGAVEAATAGHDVVMTPLADCYFDKYQSTNHAAEPHTIGGYLPLWQVYSLEPVPKDLAPQFQAHILGVQANVWTEYMPSFSQVEYMVFPRLCALAEVAWSPRSSRNWDEFRTRLQTWAPILDELQVRYRRSSLIEDKPAASK